MQGRPGNVWKELIMNALSYILIFLVAVAVGYGIYRTIRRKGKCACCDGGCSGCAAAGGCVSCKTAAEKKDAETCGDPQKKGNE